MSWLLGAANWLLLGTFPWWLWLIAGAAAAVAAMFFIPIPRVNSAVAVAVAVMLSGVGIKSWGYQQGAAHERTVWQQRVEDERARLSKEVAKAAIEEATRASKALDEGSIINHNRDTTNAIAEKDPDAAAIAIPQPLAERLWNDANGNPLEGPTK